jgi:hypothetical protein
MLAGMQSRAWLKDDDQFAPGRELFRSERRFSIWAYALSHSQLLLRAEQPPAEHRQSRIDLLFKPVGALKTRMDYDGLTLRCATTEEREHILQETGSADHNRVFVIESGAALDYVVAGAVGWQEDDQDNREPSALAFFAGATDPTRLLPFGPPRPWSAIHAAQSRD